MLGHKTSLNTFQKIKIITSILFDHDVIKLEINYKEKTKNHTNTWRLNNMLLNNEWVKNEIKEEIKDPLRCENENTLTQN